MLEILKILLPAVLVMVTVWFVLDKQFKELNRQRGTDAGHKGNILPMRLRAYERLMLVLERTLPTNLIVSVVEPGMTCLQLQSKLLTTIREEFAHNASQQIYVSNDLWTAIRNVQESNVKLVNICAAQFQQNDSATLLAERIIEVYAGLNESPSEIATALLKNEVRQQLL